MNVSQSFLALTNALVQPVAGDAVETRGRNSMFVLRGLILLFASLAVAPFFLAFHGVPSLAQTALFGLCVVPLGAITLVSKTGEIVVGHSIYVACFVGIALIAALTHETSLGCAFLWLLVAQLESTLSRERRLALGTGVLVIIAFASLAAGAQFRWFVPDGSANEFLPTGIAIAVAICNTLLLAGPRSSPREAEATARGRMQTVAEMVEDLVVSYDRDGTVTFVGGSGSGGSCESLFDLPSSDLLGRGLFEHIHVADRPIFLTAIADAAHGARTINACVRMRAPASDGHASVAFRWIEMRARRNQADRSAGVRDQTVTALLRDVTHEKNNKSAVEEARRAVTLASQAQDQFIANMSHELRTPLNAIIGFSEMLGHADLRPSDVAKQVDYARIIHESGHHLLAVVNSILDMSKLQSGTFSIVPENFDIGPLIESCREVVSLKALEGRIELMRADIPAIEPIFGDRRACKQILLNLLSNAIKFTPANGQVVIAARPEGNSLLLSVVDTGIGIGLTDLAKLGDPFFQAKSAHNRPYEGTGLGLSVVRGLVGLHGGTISIESELGHGTSVTVRLPLDCRSVTRRDHTIKIETVPRRGVQERPLFPSRDTKVKKRA